MKYNTIPYATEYTINMDNMDGETIVLFGYDEETERIIIKSYLRHLRRSYRWYSLSRERGIKVIGKRKINLNFYKNSFEIYP